MHITALQPQDQHGRRYDLYLDGRRDSSLSATLVMELGLQVGQELNEVEYEQLHARSDEDQLLDRAMYFLAPRPRSRAEVRRRLLAPRGRRRVAPPSPELVERVLDRLQALELLDDRQFADFWVENRERFSPRSARALAQELRQRGVDGDTIQQVSNPDHDEERAEIAGRLRLRALSGLGYLEFQSRLGQFLQRRGFDYDIVRRVTRRLWEEAGTPNHDADPD